MRLREPVSRDREPMRLHRKNGQTYLFVWWLKLPCRKWQARKHPQWADAILSRRCASFKTKPGGTAAVMFLNSPEQVAAVKKQLGRDKDSESHDS